MLDTLRRLMLGDPSPKVAPTRSAYDLAHLEQVIRETQADLQEAQEAVDHCRQQLAAVDARTLLDRPDTGDDVDAEDWRERLVAAQEDVVRLSAALPTLEAQRDEARRVIKQHELHTGLYRIEGQKREYGDLATVLTSQLSSAADTAAQMRALGEAIDTGRTRAYQLHVELGEAPHGISFSAVDVRALWVQMLAKARTRPAVTTSAPLPIVEPPADVTDNVTPVTTPEARTWYEADGHCWELTALATPAPCRHRMSNKSAEGPGCGEPAILLARYLMPTGDIREWPYCQPHAAMFAAAHHLTLEG